MKNFFYRVCEKDSALSLSFRFSVPLYDLIEQNRLLKEIECGDILYITPKENAYYVSPLDTIESLAERFNVPKEKILSENNIQYLFYGLVIKV